MRAAESKGTKPRKWWSDGEYDAVRADLSNDLGMGSYREGQFEAAFDHYTEVRDPASAPRPALHR